MIFRKTIVLAALIMATSCGATNEKDNESPTETSPADYVSTLVGSLSSFEISTGNTYPAIALPWGMNFWTPQTGKMGDGWTYRYDAHRIRGIKQTHQPSPWINDYGQFSIMPVRDVSKTDEEARASWFSHQSETAKPYYYSVYLADHDVKAEVAPSDRAAVLRFTFPDSKNSGVIADAFDKGSYIKVIPEEQTIVGYTTHNSGGVPENFRNWFVMKFDRPFESVQVYNGKDAVSGNEFEGEHALAAVKFATRRGDKVNVAVASSFISLEQAYTNLREVEGKDLEAVKADAKARWNDILGRIEVSGGSTDQYRTFYSCLYRSTLFPRKFYEIDKNGKVVHYSPYNGKVCGGYMYTDTGFWDTFRALFPLLNLVYPSINKEIQLGLVNIAKENPFLPEWASPGHRGCMVGNNSASVVADAIIKGVSTEDLDTLYRAIVYGTEHVHPQVNSSGRLGHEYYNTLGYIPYDVGINENVARTLEYAYNDWCILQIAKKLNRPEAEIKKWSERALNYKNVYDKSSKLMRGRNKDGSFQSPFSPYKWGDAFTEGNAWHYTWSVFHDVQGLINLMGGEKEFTEMLDSVFVVPPIYDDSYYGGRIDYRNAGGRHGQLRPRQPARPAHDLPLRLCRRTLESTVPRKRCNEQVIHRTARRLLRRRGQRTNFGLVCVLGPRFLSRVPRFGRIRNRLTSFQTRHYPPGKRQESSARRRQQLRGECLHQSNKDERQELGAQLLPLQRPHERSKHHLRHGLAA